MPSRLVRSLAVVFVMAAAFGALRTSAAAPISLLRVDTTFGVGGSATLDIGGPGPYGGGPNGVQEDEPNSIVVQPDGKYIVVGKALNPRTVSVDFAVLRYLPDGTLDPTFGWWGIVLVDFVGSHDEGMAVALQPDGKIVVAGLAGIGVGTVSADEYHGNSDFGMVRLNANGSRDTTFGWNGLVMTDWFGQPDQALGIVLQDDGKIVVGGYATRSAGNMDFALARYNPNGSLDSTFGIAGRSTANFWGKIDAIFRLERDPQGRLVAAGLAQRPDGTMDFAIARFQANGVLDSTFGLGGLVATNFFGDQDIAYSLLVEPDSSIVAGGISFNPAGGGGDIALVKYLPSGAIDTTFGNSGKVTVDFSGLYDQALWLVRQPDGKIVAVGHEVDPVTSFNFALVRFTPAGQLDPTFGNGGKYSTDFFGGPDGAHAAALLDSGALIVVGDVFNPASNSDDFGIIKYLISDPSWIAGVVRQLPAGAFDDPTRGATIATSLDNAQAALASGDAAPALATLQDLETHLQGCPTSADAGAWIVDCTAQVHVRNLVESVIARLAP